MGMLSSAGQNVRDLFHWKQKTTYYDEDGNEIVTWDKPKPPANPFKLLMQPTGMQYLAYFIGFSAWTADAFDFHTLSISTTKLAASYGVSKSKVTEAITLTLLLRSVGAVLFGVCSDFYGRKYPLVINMWALGALQVGSIYCKNFDQLLAVRAVFGLMMGGVYGGASAMALEGIPVECRGLFSGIFQQGYAFGYVLAACVNLGVGGATETWKIGFWVGAGMSFVVGFMRLAFPESKQFIEARKENKGKGTAAFRKNFVTMLKKEWKVCVYAIILMSWFNWFSHTSQDSYTTFMLVGKGLNNAAASRASILMKTGACVGGTIWGYTSQWVGRRRAMIICCLLCCVLIPAWVLPTTESGLEAGGFMLQAMVQGAWGVVPVYLSEISPPAFRAIFVGLTYQLGNAISSPSTQVINILSEHHKVTFRGRQVEAYGPVMAIATAIIAVGLALTASVGPEKKGAHFEEAPAATVVADPALQEKVIDDDGSVQYAQSNDNKDAKDGNQISTVDVMNKA